MGNQKTMKHQFIRDEGILLYPNSSKRTREYVQKVKICANQHLLNNEKTGLKSTGTIKQRMPAFLDETIKIIDPDGEYRPIK